MMKFFIRGEKSYEQKKLYETCKGGVAYRCL